MTTFLPLAMADALLTSLDMDPILLRRLLACFFDELLLLGRFLAWADGAAAVAELEASTVAYWV